MTSYDIVRHRLWSAVCLEVFEDCLKRRAPHPKGSPGRMLVKDAGQPFQCLKHPEKPRKCDVFSGWHHQWHHIKFIKSYYIHNLLHI
jgi:hypothetical protein